MLLYIYLTKALNLFHVLMQVVMKIPKQLTKQANPPNSDVIPPGPVGDGLELMHKKLGRLDGRMHILPGLKRT